jgi:hypothetical protein
MPKISNIFQLQVCPIVRSETPECVTRSVPVCRLSHQPGTFHTSRALASIIGSSYVMRMRATANPCATCESCSVIFPYNAFQTTYNCKIISLCILSLYSSLFWTYKQGVSVSQSVSPLRQTYILQPLIDRMPCKRTLQNILYLHISVLNLL